MHLVPFVVAVLGVEIVICEIVRTRTYNKFPGKQLSVNGSSSLEQSKSDMSVNDCAIWCLNDAHCEAAYYEDAGVCHMSSGGCISMEDNNHTTVLLPLMLLVAHQDPLHLDLVGLWPLQEAYGGEDLSCHGNHIELNEVAFPYDDITPWVCPAAYFNETLESYGHIQHGQHLDVTSFSWMAKVFPTREDRHEILLQWLDINGDVGAYISLNRGSLLPYIPIPGCTNVTHVHFSNHPASLPLNRWSTVAMTFDLPTNYLTMWQNEESARYVLAPCGVAIGTSPQLYVGHRLASFGLPYGQFHGRMSCMGLFSSVVDYDVMNAVTMQQCGG